MGESLQRPVIIDFDRSVGVLPGCLRLPLAAWQEAIRFGCSLATLRLFDAALADLLPRDYGTVFTGSGDFHHVTWPLIAKRAVNTPVQVVVFDNHPDNMRFPFAVHCGSWVRRAAALPFVDHVHVLGITSTDIDASHAWENYATPLLRGKLTYWSIGVETGWARWFGLSQSFRNFDTPEAMVDAFVEQQRSIALRSYLSIDKDVFHPDTARTNWDQGCLRLPHACALIRSLRPHLVGSDINGEVSLYHYQTWWKRGLSALDAQPEVDPESLVAWQAQQHSLNERLLEVIALKG